jgi:hypothetical protein
MELRAMSSPKHTKIELTREAYLALESETLLQSKTLKRLAYELILDGVSKASLDFARMTVNEPNTFDEDKMAKVIKDIGNSAIRFAESLLGAIREKLLKEGYLGTMLYVAQNTASIERDELHRVLTICAYHKLPPALAADVFGKLNVIKILVIGMISCSTR